MKKTIAIFVLSVLFFILAIFTGLQASLKFDRSGSHRGAPIPDPAMPTKVLPPEELPQFKNGHIYTPAPLKNTLYADPFNDDLKTDGEEAKKVPSGVM